MISYNKPLELSRAQNVKSRFNEEVHYVVFYKDLLFFVNYMQTIYVVYK